MIHLVQLGLPDGGSLSLPVLLAGMIVYLLPVLAAVWVYRDAKAHDRKAVLWAVGTLVLGPFAVLTLTIDFVTRQLDDEVFDPLGRHDT